REGGAFPAESRFIPVSEKFEASAATVVPDANIGALVFTLPLRKGEKISGTSELCGVLVAPDGNAIAIYENTFSAGNAQAAAAGTTEATEEPAASASEFSFDFAFVGLLALAFAGGLILNLMPCVFPVLGLKIMHFVGKAGSDKKKIARHGFVFGAGVLISFWILAGALAVLRSGGEQLGWGFQLQEPGFVYGMILLMLVFGLSMSGVFEFGVGATSVGGSLTEKSGYAGSFFSGVLAVIIATPCAAPFLAPALGSALTLPLVPSFALFTAIAVGLAAPYVILSCVPALLKFLPKPGAWMETFKQAMAFLLYAPALYFVWVLMGQVEDAFAQRDLLLSLSVVALACWIYGKWATPWRSRFARVAGTLIAVVLFAGTVFYALNLLYGKKSEDWVAWSPEAQAEALEDGKIVYIDFTARWCATCQVNKRVYDDPELKKELSDADVVKMRADWTNKNATIANELSKYGRAAVPVNVFLKDGKEPVILGELFSGPGTVSAGLQEISAESAE
ncbi:MAG: thioredoxin family protein, partial [Opitutales bacterium]|nr:thioredoxin family protein [Opitutales bacterium]